MAAWTHAMSLRIFLSEDDTYDGRPLHEAILRTARDVGLAGAKVVRGVAGFGRSRHIHESWRGFSYDLPVVVEVIDTAEKIEAFVPALQRLRADAVVILQPVQLLQTGGADVVRP